MTEKEVDITKPFFNRGIGQLGIYMTIYDAEPVNAKEVGSEHFYLMDLTERLCEYLEANYPLPKLKGVFERLQMFDGVIFEPFRKGVVLPISPDHTEGLKEVWQAFEKGQLATILSEHLISQSALKELRAKKIDLKIKLYEDEYKECTQELSSGKIKDCPLSDQANDLDMVLQAMKFQKSMSRMVLEIRDDFNKFEHNLGEFMINFKRQVNEKTKPMKNFKEFEAFLAKVRCGRGVNPKVVNAYGKLYRKIKDAIANMEEGICHPLAQVHARCESGSQRELKLKMKESCLEGLDVIQFDYDFSDTVHLEWKKKVRQDEQRFLLGPICILAQGIDVILDIDQNFDEYLSGVPGDLKQF